MTLGKTGLTFTPSVTLGQLLSPISVIAIAVSAWLYTHGMTAEDTKGGLDRLNAMMDRQFDTIGRRIDAVNVSIANLPAQAARLDQVERRETEQGARYEALASKLTDTDRLAIEARETAKRLDQQVQSLDRQMNTPVPVRNTR